MAITEDRFRDLPALRLELTEEQREALAALEEIGEDVMVFGYCAPHRWPSPESRTLVLWKVSRAELEKALKASNVMAARPVKRRKKPRKR